MRFYLTKKQSEVDTGLSDVDPTAIYLRTDWPTGVNGLTLV